MPYLQALNREYGLDLNAPVKDLDKKHVDLLLYGTEGKKLKVEYTKDGVKAVYNYAYDGEINSLNRRYRETNSDMIKGEIEQYMSDDFCPKCKGARLKDDALAVTVGGKNIYELYKYANKRRIRVYKWNRIF